jgi:septal ring factor EnvC (AmiA/AmiB activator)
VELDSKRMMKNMKEDIARIDQKHTKISDGDRANVHKEIGNIHKAVNDLHVKEVAREKLLKK